MTASYNQHQQDIKDGKPDDGTIAGLAIGVFFAIFLIALGLWIWGIVLLSKYWNVLPDWAKVLGVIGILGGFPLLTIIVVFCGRPAGVEIMYVPAPAPMSPVQLAAFRARFRSRN